MNTGEDLILTPHRAAIDILGIQGSPRRKGNTDLLLDEVLAAAAAGGAAVEKIVVRDLRISPCLEIYHCEKNGECAINDDMQTVYPKLLEARVVILATPVFFYGPSALIKSLIDRCQALWARKYRLGLTPGPKKRGQGCVISVAATGGKKLFDGVLLTARYFFDVLDLEMTQPLLVRRVDQAGDVLRHQETMDQARLLGQSLSEYITGISKPSV